MIILSIGICSDNFCKGTKKTNNCAKNAQLFEINMQNVLKIP